MIIAAWSVIITKLIILKAVRPRDDFIGEFKYYLPLSMNNENKVDRIGVQLQNESLSFSFVSTFYLGCRFYVIDHAITRSRRSPNMTQHVVACMTGALWAKWTQEISALQEKVNGCRVGEILWAWSWGWAMWKAWKRPAFIFCRMLNFSKCQKMKPSPLDGLFFVIYAVASVLAETPTSGNNVDTSGENNSTIKDTKMHVGLYPLVQA